MAAMYNHRAADVVKSPTAVQRQNQPRYLTLAELQDPTRLAMPASWVDEGELPAGLPDWLVGYSWVTSPTNERSMVAYALPRTAVGNSVPVVQSVDPILALGIFNSFALDYALRQKLNGVNLTFTVVGQLPVPAVSMFQVPSSGESSVTLMEWVKRRVIELSYTAVDLVGIATKDALPMRFDTDARSRACAEIDAAMFNLYGLTRDDVDYVMDTFPIVKRKDEAEYGSFRTKELILEAYDELAKNS